MKSLQEEPYRGPHMEKAHQGWITAQRWLYGKNTAQVFPRRAHSASLWILSPTGITSCQGTYTLKKSYPIILLGLRIQPPKYTKIRLQAPCDLSLLLHPSSHSQSTSDILSESTNNPPVPLPVCSIPSAKRRNLELSEPGSESSLELFQGVRVTISYPNIIATWHKPLRYLSRWQVNKKKSRIFCWWGMEGERGQPSLLSLSWSPFHCCSTPTALASFTSWPLG